MIIMIMTRVTSLISYVGAFERWAHTSGHRAVAFADRVKLTIHFGTVV